MANQRRTRSPWLLPLLLLSGGASAASLSNLQMLNAPNVPIECAMAYNTELPGCDFQSVQGPRCTGRCRNSLEAIQQNLQIACIGVQAGQGTVLNVAQAGQLVQAVCGNGPGNGNGRGPPADKGPPNREENNQKNPIMTVTMTAPINPGESLITAPGPTPAPGNDGNAPARPTSATVTITTAIVPKVPANVVGQNPFPTADRNPNIPAGGGGTNGFDSIGSGSAPMHLRQATSVICAIAAGAVFLLM
ncbi:hypothetical protein HJFPF1_06979 [Paramyrothecium foliicola]|nr:hypothetical protein HJFPF1_06979 [Paramyrothecium foliicola]